ncbi:MAG: ABC transporter substrate-binding protein [Candidatus Omnitrophica bacterium]|nr:ABC transporter substrate-binding protein [Candidatus Omnitrophota bacterium]
MKIRIGHSPDPDDAFLFYGLTHGKVAVPGVSISHLLEGIEELNQRALKGELEMSAISLHAYPYVADKYLLMTTGASMGEGYGPVVISREQLSPEDLKKVRVAVPGRLTTAALLLQLAAGRIGFEIMPFDRILAAVEEGAVEAGVLIHEGQITYSSRGLKKVLDLGEWWHARTGGLPVPLGVNVLRRDLGESLLRELAAAFKASLDYAFAHRAQALEYAGQWARGLDPPNTDKFVGMYVNRWSVDCRPDGARAMQKLLDWSAEAGLTPGPVRLEYVEVEHAAR